MKRKTFYGILILLVLLIGSCKQWIDTNLNVDPTAPLDASLQVILPPTQASFGYVFGGDVMRYANMFTQQINGTGKQHLTIYNYSITESDPDNAWSTMYTGPMENLHIIMQKAAASGSYYYLGIAQIEMAACLGMWVDVVGDIPYSQAFQGNANLKPIYDKGPALYDTIQHLLDQGIANLQIAPKSLPAGALIPSTDDMIYGGNNANWISAANTLKARYYLHLKQYSQVLSLISSGITAFANDFQFNYAQTESTSNPLYQFIEYRYGDIETGGYMINYMNSVSDPRVPFYAYPDATNNYTSQSDIGPGFSNINSPVIFTSYMELKFMEAEAQFQSGNQAAAYAAYIAGTQASLEKIGVAAADEATFMARPDIAVGAANLTLNQIIMQKYVALFCNPETWTDWRRTGYPVLTPVVGSQIPRRFPYPQSERLFNLQNLNADVPNHADPSFIYTRIWWDTP